MVERLRKRQRQFRRWRFPLLLIHGLLLISWFMLLFVVTRFSGDEMSRLILVTYMMPPIFTFVALSSVLLGQVIWNWRGEPKTDLLLRVIDELREGDANKTLHATAAPPGS